MIGYQLQRKYAQSTAPFITEFAVYLARERAEHEAKAWKEGGQLVNIIRVEIVEE